MVIGLVELDVSTLINYYMNVSEKALLTALVHHIERFSKSGIPICISEVPEKSRPKEKIRELQNAKLYKKTQ